ncbi:cuticle protein 8-like [Penaeus vannamei]|uniref:cuticle protein 8-like n=1 Tax=Penaeus vannamei TaxID=6689 RepID=UPI00387F559B
MSAKLIIFAALVAVALARPDQPPAYGYAAPTPAPAPAKYDFNYAVKDEYSGNDFGHQEARDGYDTQGAYYVLLPDGRLQKVAYTVNGDSGYVAEVSYEGEAQYPAEQPAYKPAPSYSRTQAYSVVVRGWSLKYINRPLATNCISIWISLIMSAKLIVFAALVAVALARPDQPPAYGYAAPTPAPAPAKYDFNYAVKDDYSGNDFGHQEARDGYDTQGAYYVLLPDGRLQKVAYTVNGDSGFVAEVSYEGEAQYPAEQPAYKPAPSYA